MESISAELDECKLNEACGVFGCVEAAGFMDQHDVPGTIALGLLALQHRYSYLHLSLRTCTCIRGLAYQHSEIPISYIAVPPI